MWEEFYICTNENEEHKTFSSMKDENKLNISLILQGVANLIKRIAWVKMIVPLLIIHIFASHNQCARQTNCSRWKGALWICRPQQTYATNCGL